MLDRPEVLESTPQTMAALRLTIPRDRTQREMIPGLKELHAAGLGAAWGEFDDWIRAQGHAGSR